MQFDSDLQSKQNNIWWQKLPKSQRPRREN